MPFRFKKSETPARAVRRVYRERVGAALDCLKKPKHPAAVHGARKEIKKLRALLRLVRGEISVGTYRKGVKALRAAADCLAAARDARVMLKAFVKLTGQTISRYPRVEKALNKNAKREAKRFRRNHAVTLAEKMLRKTSRCASDLKIKRTGWAAIEPGLRQSYQRGREACQMAANRPAPERFHDWRRHVKDLWFYFCLLQPVSPAATRATADNLELLAERLGEDHDLFLLQEFIFKKCQESPAETHALTRLIAARQKKLRIAAVRLGTRLYARSPDEFCRQLAAWRR